MLNNNPKNPYNSLWWRVFSLVIIFAILMSLAIVKDGSLFGHTFTHEKSPLDEMTLPDGSLVVNTTEIGRDISGYAGPTPLEIHISSDGIIESVKALDNHETPGFFNRLSDSGLFESWNNKTPAEARALKVDAVSGATFSSNAVIGNVNAGLDLVIANNDKPRDSHVGFSWVGMVALITICGAALLPLWIHNKTYRFIQQLINVGILGFWAGTFIDYAMMLNVFANGLSFGLAGIVTIALLIVGFIFPLFGKHQHYCSWVCPLGSAQELMGHLSKHKISLSPNAIKGLNLFRKALWVVLLLLLWIGIGTEWIDHEIFAAFIVKSASPTMLIIGGLILLLSIFIPRPFCRFICPTGTILKCSENLNN